MSDTFDVARARILAEWELVSMHVPAGVAALVFPLRAISLLHGERGSITVSRDYLGDPNDPASTAVIVAGSAGAGALRPRRVSPRRAVNDRAHRPG